MNKKSRIINLSLGPLLFLGMLFFLPQSIFSTAESRGAIGTVAWMAVWWVTGPIDYAVTAFLPIAVNAVFQMTDMSSVIANYASETILLLLGASILTVSWEETGLDKRIAAHFLGFIGNDLRKQIIFWFILSAGLSAILPNAVVCATITPIAVAMLKYIGEGEIEHSRIGSKLLLTIAYATGVGGLMTPLGGAMNLVTIDYIQKITNTEFFYVSWFVKFLPICIVLIISNIAFLVRDIKKEENVGASKEYFVEQYKKMPPMSFEETCSLVMFLAATVLSFTRQFYQSFLPGLKPAYVFIICAILSFMITKRDGKRLMVWRSVQTKVIWELIYIFSGGLAAGTLINESGAAQELGDWVANCGLQGGFVTVFVIISVTILLSDVTSNTATAAIAMPIIISITQGIGLNPIPYIYIASVGVNLSYMLPTSIRAIPVGYGLPPKYMFSEGVKITVMVIVLMVIMTYMMLKFWPAFSLA